MCTGVNPPGVAPPQKPRAPTLGLVGKSFWVLGVMSGLWPLLVAETGGERGPGGGRTGASPMPRPLSRDFLRAAISCLSATFSDFEDPSSERMAEMSASRSEMSASSVEMYSVGVNLSQRASV